MTQQVSDPPERDDRPPAQNNTTHNQHARSSMLYVIVLLSLVGLLVLSSFGLLIFNVVQAATGANSITPTVSASQTALAGKASTTPTPALSPTPTSSAPFFPPNNAPVPVLQLPTGHTIIYEQEGGIYIIPSASSVTPTPSSVQQQPLKTPGYQYNEAVRPILTPSGQLLYTGAGIWLLNIFTGATTQIASLAPNQSITSMALSSDGTTIAWSTEPANGNGVIDIYAGPLNAPVKVLERSSASCPCFRVFGFLNGSGAHGNTTLLLTDSQQTHEAIQFGLWTFDLTAAPLTTGPEPLLSENNAQGPLALAPYSNVLLYSSYEGEVPVPTDGSVPNDVATLTYPNSLDLTTLDGRPLVTDGSQVVLPEQHELLNTANTHWITTPIFTPDGSHLLYVEFSSQSQPPYDRSSAIFIVSISGSGATLHVGKPQLLLASGARLAELGGWFSSTVVTLYADGTLYALDIQHGTIATLVQTGAYARIIGAVGTGGI